MPRNPTHAMQARPNHDERARTGFVGALKLYVGRRLRPGNRAFFELEAAPAWRDTHGRAPDGPEEIGEAMRANPHWQLWSILHRNTQEQMWEAVGETLQREEPRLAGVYRKLTARPRGSLEIDEAFEVPEVIRRSEIHLQPGSYALDRGDTDFLAGAFYEAGGTVYSQAQGVGTGESKAEIVLRTLADRYPGFAPRRILDMACSAGASSTPYAEAFPEAEVHAIDVGPGLLRYAHARAEALGVAVHFHQRNVAATGFPDGHFDLVVSHNAMHEMSADTVAAMMRESYRLLAPGGICIHQDVPLRFDALDDYGRFEFCWDRDYNCEPFWEVYARSDPGPAMAAAGFDPDETHVGFLEQGDGSFRWYVAMARKA